MKNSRRYFIVLGTFLLALLLYVDRVCISIAKDPIAQDLQLSDQMMGWVLSIFALGYALFQTPGGMLSDRFGPRKALAGIVTIWSVFTALTGMAWNYVSLMVFRFLFGAGEAGAFPGIARSVYSWFPLKERGIVNGINFSGSRIGAAFALPAIALLIESFGWRGTFLILFVVGLVWALAWFAIFRDMPEEHPWILEKEKQLIVESRQESKQSEHLPLSELFRHKNMWLMMGQYFASNFTFFFSLTWMFPHLKSTYHLESTEAGFLAALPLIAGAFGNWFSGWLVDRIYAKGDWKQSRVIPSVVGFIFAAVGLLGSLYMTEALPAVLFLSLAIFGADMTLAPSWSFCVDIGKNNAGVVSGTMNMAGNIGSFITALAFPYLFAWTGSVNPFFYLACILNLGAIFLWLKINPYQPIEKHG